MNNKEVCIYNNIVDFLEKSDTICKKDNKWFAIGYLEALKMQSILTYKEVYKIMKDLVENEILWVENVHYTLVNY